MSALFLNLWLAGSSFADNSTMASVYNQLSNGRYCGQVTAQDLKAAGFSCSSKGPSNEFIVAASQIFEGNVFQLAAPVQIQKNKCLLEQMQVIQKDPQQKDNWQLLLLSAWMGMKKSELILNKCSQAVLSRLEPADIRRYGTDKAFEKALRNDAFGTFKELQEAWKKICFDHETLSKLRAAHQMFQSMLPVISHPQLFATMEKNRNLIISHKTGKPLTDDELLSMDVRDLRSITPTFTPEFDKELDQNLNLLGQNRKNVNRDLLESHGKEGYDLSSDMKQFLYEDGSVDQVLKSKKMIPPNYKGLHETPPSQVSSGAFCILARYEPTFTGELIGMGVETAVGGGLIFKGLSMGAKALKGVKYAEEFSLLSKGQQVRRAMSLGLMTTGYPMIGKQIANECSVPVLGDDHKGTEKMRNRSMISMPGKGLPPDLGFEITRLSIDARLAPSCPTIEEVDPKTKEKKKVASQNLLFDPQYDQHCVLSTLLGLAPLKVTLPVLVLGNNSR